MGKLISGGILSTEIKGKVGNIIFKRVNRETIMAPYQPTVANPRTLAQMRQRYKFRALSHIVSEVYTNGAKRYGVKLANHNIYSSIAAMIHRNPIVLAAGYQGGFIPYVPKNNQNLLADNNKLNDQFCEKVYLGLSSDLNNLEIGFKIDSSLVGQVPQTYPGPIYIGVNNPFTDLSYQLVFMGSYISEASLISNATLSLNTNFGTTSGSKMVSSVRGDISGNYQYIVSTPVINIADLSDEPGFAKVVLKTTNEGEFGLEQSWSGVSIKAGWPGVEVDDRLGFTAFIYSVNKSNNVTLPGNEYGLGTTLGSNLEYAMVSAENIVVTIPSE